MASASVNLTVGWNTVSAYACNSSQCDNPSVQVYYPPPVYSVSVTASGPATTIPGYPTGAAGFRVIHNGARTGPMRIDFAASCAGVAGAPCSPSPARIDAAYPGDEYFVSVSFGVSPVGTSGSVTLTATPAGGSAQSATASVSPTPVYKVVVSPQSGSATVHRGGRHQVAFTVDNQSDNAADPLTFNAAVITCDGAAANCAPSSSSIAVSRGSPGTLSVGFDASGPGSRATIQLRMSLAGNDGVASVGTYAIDVTSVLDAEVRTVNPGTAIDRGECLTIAAGSGAAYECGALRLVHELPTTRTMNKARTPTLFYNSQHAEPTAFVAADVRYSGATVPSVFRATLRIAGRPDVVQQFPWASSCQGQWCRVTLKLSQDLPTNLYEYSVQVQALANGSEVASSVPASDTLVVVNRRGSHFGAGWWLAGFEELKFVSSTKILWVGGDGSTRLYTKKDATAWVVEPAVDGVDTLSTDGSVYRRHLPDGARVVFNGGGQHVQTVNRRGHVTHFGYTSVGGQSVLQTIQLPTPAGGTARTYTFEYGTTSGGAPVLRYVHAPDLPGVARTTTIRHASAADNLVSSILDPDGSEVAFGFAAGARVGFRRNRRGDVTRFGYEAEAAFVRVEFDRTRLEGASKPPVVSTICPAEAQALAPCTGGMRPAQEVRTLLNGPRADAQDTMAFYLTRWGTPRLVVNAKGHTTTVERAEGRFPMLATAVVNPKGLRVEAFYNGRALLDSTRLIDPLERNCTDGSCNAVTKYGWDPVWRELTSMTLPEKEATTFGVDAATGTRIWMQDGRGGASRINFHYYTAGAGAGLLEAVELPGGLRETVIYDPQLANASTMRTPLGHEARLEYDQVGRVRVARQQIEKGNLSIWKDDTTTYDLMDNVTKVVSGAPAYGGAAQMETHVRTFVNAEGQPDSVHRWSRPDPNAIDTIKTSWRYDALGRVVLEIAPDGERDSTVYDDAGNMRERLTRRRDASGAPYKIEMTYDILNRLAARHVPEARYGPRDEGLANADIGVWEPERTTYPRFPNDPSNPGGYTVFADDAVFDYDALGNITQADNGSARVGRTYYRSGTLRDETLTIRARDVLTDGTTWTRHVYMTSYNYDRNLRLTEVRHPSQLAPVVNGVRYDVAKYTYNPLTAALESVTDPLGHRFTYAYNLRGEVERLQLPRTFYEQYEYDNDGNFSRHFLASNGGTWRDTYLGYDARGKVLSSSNNVNIIETHTARYSGLGYITSSEVESRRPGNITYISRESFTLDALANLATKNTRQERWINGYLSPGSTRNYVNTYQPWTGRLTKAATVGQTDVSKYDAAGNIDFVEGIPGHNGGYEDRASFYGADGLLRAAEYRVYPNGLSIIGPFKRVFEEFRYDAVGRRVLVWTRRYCENIEEQNERGECNQSSIRRTVWTGSHELYEINMPAREGAPVDTVENDVAPVRLAHAVDDRGNNTYWDPNPLYGRVAYTYGPAIDQPLSVTRINYADAYYGKSWLLFKPFTWVPLWNYRRQADNWFVAETGNGAYCEAGNQCAYDDFQLAWTVYHPEQRPTHAWAWHGTLIRDKQDHTGTFYRRARHYDARTGRFTQEDPIGLAGGLNLYGFANGDPVNFSDPFGLCGIVGAIGSVAAGAGLAIVTGGTYTVAAALVDAGSGAVCAGAISKMVKLGKAVRAGRAARASAAGARVLANARRRAVAQAWRQEQELVRRTGRGTREWSAAEKDELLRTGKVKGYEGHHINNVEDHPNLAGDPDNIEFVLGRAEHLDRHGGHFRNPSSGPTMNRNPDP
jgi:RHS repeat-associated protein